MAGISLKVPSLNQVITAAITIIVLFFIVKLVMPESVA